jgi:hypothetical protein
MSERTHHPDRGQPERGKRRLQATIAGLRLCNAAQNDLIANFEDYQRKVLGVGVDLEESLQGGYQGSYGAELGYLHSRRHAIDSLIAAVERYHSVADGLILDREEESVAD